MTDEPMNTGEDDLVTVGRADQQAEAEFLQNLLRDAGVASVVRRAAGFDVPDFLAAGPRDILVAASDAPAARDVLGQEGRAPQPPSARPGGVMPLRLLAGLLIGALVLAGCIWLGVALLT